MYRYLIDEKSDVGKLNSAEDIVKRISKSGASCIKLYFENGYGNIDIWPTLSSETLLRIRQSAKKMKLPILAHANALDMQKLALEADVDVIAHGMWNWGKFNQSRSVPKPIAAVLDRIVNNKIGYIPTQRVIAGLGEVMIPNIVESPEFRSVTPLSLLAWYKSKEAQWFKKELRVGFDGMPDNSITEVFLYGKIGKGEKVIDYLNKSKHSLMLGSDFPGSPSYANQPDLTTYQEMKAMRSAGLTLDEVLAAATINNAMQFNMHDNYGTVEVGKIANLLLLNENPLDKIEAWNSIHTVVLKGRAIARNELAARQ